jgi:squalene synthase HpnC
MDLAAELARFGPAASSAVFSAEEARAYCRRLAESHYENFTVASRFFPRHLHQHFCNVYAYCRWADDLADEGAGDRGQGSGVRGQGTGVGGQKSEVRGQRSGYAVGTSAVELLEWWEGQLEAAYAGEARHPVFVALVETIEEVAVPKESLADLLVAFQRDQVQTRYETLAELLTYCQKSANPVGRIVLHLGRAIDDENVRLSDSICTGLQLANFWQDVRRDYESGRIYIPQENCRRHGWDEARFAAGRCDAAFREMMRPLVEDAESRLLAGQPLVGRVGRDLRLPVRLFIGGGLAVLAAIKRSDYDVWSRRPVVGRLTKLRLVVAALLSTNWWRG